MHRGKIFLIDYIGQSDDKGIPVGHTVKTITETINLLDQIIKVELVIPKNCEKEFSGFPSNIKFNLNHYSKINTKNLFKRIPYFGGELINLFKIYFNIKKNEGILWFVNSDFLLFMFLFFYPFKIRNKLILTLFLEGFNSNNTLRAKIKDYFFRHSIHKVDWVIKNNEKMKIIDKELFYPDYIYKKEKYKKYSGNKNDHILCVGIMNRSKDLLNLVRICRESGLKLRMIGFFPDKNQLTQLKKYSSKKIAIQDEYLPQDEYYKEISRARFCVLPYKKTSYNRRTSGILLESIFLNTIVIAPNFLLNYANLPGIGYDRLENIKPILGDMDDEKTEKIYEEMRKVREEFSIEKIKKKIYKALENLDE